MYICLEIPILGCKTHRNRLANMPDPKQLPYLIRLLDDDSPIVRDAVLKELASFGPSLEPELAHLQITPNQDQMLVIEDLLATHSRQWLQEAWPTWFGLKDDKDMLERALSLLAEFQNGRSYPVKLTMLLDRLAQDYRLMHQQGDSKTLAHLLFRERRLKGASHQDYYDPQNSNLVYVIEKHRGIPISLVCIYILVGHRLGLEIEGCNLPGHFLAIASMKKQRYIVDCFNGARFIKEQDLTDIDATISLEDIIRLECQAPTIIARVLRNLTTAYQHVNSAPNMQLMVELTEMIERESNHLFGQPRRA